MSTSNADPPDVVESGRTGPSDAGSEPPTLAPFFRRRILFGVLAVVLVVGGVAVASRSDAHAIVPDLVGVRVDPQLDALRLRLETADLALGPCPEFDIPGVSLEQVPGTIIDQHPAGGAIVVTSTAVDVTVRLPDRG
jgi:hypothetical protein